MPNVVEGTPGLYCTVLYSTRRHCTARCRKQSAYGRWLSQTLPKSMMDRIWKQWVMAAGAPKNGVKVAAPQAALLGNTAQQSPYTAHLIP